MSESADIAEQFEKHLNSPKHTWLLGAGISFLSNIPLMLPLTGKVLSRARNEKFADDADAIAALDFLQGDVRDGCHIEDMLTHLGDCISMAERSRTDSIRIGQTAFHKDKLISVHRVLLEIIAETVRWGFRPAKNDAEGHEIEPERCGKRGESIVEIEPHSRFVQAVVGQNREGRDQFRSPVEFFTTNYDTLLEDSLALNQVPYSDGFTGGGMGFWSIENYSASPHTRAIVTKLHGSTDWYRPDKAAASVLRIRDGDLYPSREGGAVMIYPQSTKYQNAQRDPFLELFQRFRHRLSTGPDQVLLICGYSYGDIHINDDIERAMSSPRSQLTIIAFSDEPEGQFPPTLKAWIDDRPWG
ncbi:MAG: SIR2 family protein, partial [Alteraurantiacibacter sp. bin_em_oilr2.035]|nr:SIR2 family protein [Alteraurantiacibacter sp. bin_em_oilr2.035]